MILTLPFLFAVLTAINAAEIPLALHPKIVNGEDVKLGEIPYQVSLQQGNWHFCGGSILNENYVLTAAHCLKGMKASKVKAVAGLVDLKKRGTVHHGSKIILHENYDSGNHWINDVALLKVQKPFRSKSISFITLPAQNFEVPAGTLARVSGWGRLSHQGDRTDQMKKANVYITEQGTCRSIYGTVHDTQICAWVPTADRGFCQGDSGGPLTVDGTIVGIVSWASGCGWKNYPGVYTRVPSFVDWIKEHAV